MEFRCDRQNSAHLRSAIVLDGAMKDRIADRYCAAVENIAVKDSAFCK